MAALVRSWMRRLAIPFLNAERDVKDTAAATDRIAWILTGDPAHGVHGITVGMSVKEAARHLGLGTPFRVGKNIWYLAPDGRVRAMLRVQGGVVKEVGVASQWLTAGSQHRRAVFLRGF